MKSRTLLVSILLVLGLLLVACGGTDDVATVIEEVAPVVEDAVEEVADAVETAVEEVVEEPTAEPIMEEADLDGAYTVFLDDMEGYNTIAPEMLYGLTAAGGNDVYVLDVRSPSELVEHGWIEGAINIPLRDLANSTEYLPSEDTTIVTYCGSGWRCTIALTALEAMGWDDVLGLKGGSYAGWVEAGYPISAGTPDELVALNAFEPDAAIVAEMQEMLSAVPDDYGVITAEALDAELAENADLIVIDVRRAEEVEENGHVDAENILFIPLEEFIANADQWPADLDTPIVTYCGSGHRSTIAMSILWGYDYTDVRSLKGGFGGWAGEGYPVAGAVEAEEMEGEMMETAVLNDGFQIFLDDMEAYNTISPDVLYGMTAGGNDVFVLDVRNPDELTNNGWIENATNIPLFELADSTAYLPSFDTPIVSYCGSGWRCTIALTMLEGMGWEDVKGLKGGSYAGWVDAGFPISAGMAPEAVELNAVEVADDVVAAAQELLAGVPEGFGVITAENLLLEQEANDELILIDVRQSSELAEKGIIEHDADRWMNIPLEDFVASEEMWPADLDAPIVVYCGSGHRSTIAMTMLYANGYTNVHSLKGGFGGWAEAGNPVVDAPAELSLLNDGFQIFLDDMEAYNTISPDVLYGMTAGGNDVFVLDVRNPDELTNNGWIENATNIPLFELADSTAYLPSFDTPIVSYCGSGWRCTIALTMLEGMGWEDVKGLKGGSYAGWVDAGFPISAGMAPEAVELNAVEVADDVVAAAQELLAGVPEGFGVITAENLLLEQEANDELILIDVRQSSELAEKGIIEHDADRWMNIPLEDFVASEEMWPADLDAPIVVYCGSGHRSTIAMTMLYANGYTNVHSLKGGFGGWTEAGYPVMEYATP